MKQFDQYCSKCTTKMEKLRYYYDDDWGHKGSTVFNNNQEEIGDLVYCPNCGELKVNLLRD